MCPPFVAFYNRTESLTIDEVIAEFNPVSLDLFFQLIQAADMLLVHLLSALVIFPAMIFIQRRIMLNNCSDAGLQ